MMGRRFGGQQPMLRGRGGMQRGVMQRGGMRRGGPLFGGMRRGVGRRGGWQAMGGRMMMWRKMLGQRGGFGGRAWGRQAGRAAAPKVPQRPSVGPGWGRHGVGIRPFSGRGAQQQGRWGGRGHARPGGQPDVRSRLKGWLDRLSPEQKEKMKSWGEQMRKRFEAHRRGPRKPAAVQKPAPKKPAPRKPAPRKPAPQKPAPQKPAPQKPAPQRPSLHRPQGGPQGRQGGPLMRVLHFLRTKDKNHDRKLDLKEFGGDAAKFKTMDKDKDGFLSMRELFAGMGGGPRR